MDINLDLTRRTSEIPRFVMQHEVDSRTLNFTILNNGVAFDLTSKTVTLCMEKPDGELIYNAVTVPVGTAGKCNITLTAQAQAAAGVAKCWVKIVDGESVTYSPQFDIEIRDVTDFSGAVESTSEFTALDTALAQIAGFEARIGDQAYTEKNYISDGDPLTTSIDDLDMALKEHADLSVLTGTVHGVAITSGSGSLTPTAQSGTITTATATYTYYRIGKLLVYQIACVITEKGDGAGLLILTGLPILFAASTSGVGYNEDSGAMIRGYSAGNAIVVTNYDSSTVIADATTVRVTIVGITV